MSSTSSTSLFSFGLLADPQYAACEPNLALSRFYRESLGKLSQAIDVFNGEALSFVVTLGDIIDRDFKSFDDILPVYDRLRHERFFLLGNHDFAIAPEYLETVCNRLGMPAPFYSFVRHGWRFILLNGNEVSSFAPVPGHPYRTFAEKRLAELTTAGEANAQPWNAAMSDAQFDWLSDEVGKAETAGERVIVMNHYPVYPPNEHDAWDREQIMSLLTANRHVAAYFCGHNHAGGFGEVDGLPFVTVKGMVDTPDQNTFAVVDVEEMRLVFRGFGREESRILPLRS